MSVTISNRELRRARNLADDDMAVLKEHKVPEQTIDFIAALGKGAAIDWAMKLIRNGMLPEVAARQAARLRVPRAAKTKRAATTAP